MIKAFDDLTAWVHKGTKPAGDEVCGDLSNAGMTFTDPLRPERSGRHPRRGPDRSQP